MKAKAGQSLTEYGLVVLLIALVAVTALTTLGGSLSDKLSSVSQAFFDVNTFGGNERPTVIGSLAPVIPDPD